MGDTQRSDAATTVASIRARTGLTYGQAVEHPHPDPSAQDVLGVPSHLAPTGRRLVLIPVGQFDLRVTRPVEYAWRIWAHERRALHVASGEADLWELGAAWMSSDMPLPLFTVESDGDIADTVAQVVQLELASGFDEVVVLLGRVALGRPYHRVLHDRTANAISRAVGRLPHAMVAMMTVANT